MPPRPYQHLIDIRSRDRGGSEIPFDRPSKIEHAEIIRVDPALFVVDLVTEYTGRKLRNVSVGGSGVSRLGNMNGYFPEIGDRCLVAFPSDDLSPEILRFLPYFDPRTGARGQRKAMNPGDSLMSTYAGNHVHVAAGGVVDIAANPITRRLYVPFLNQIKDFCENYFLSSAGGRVVWENRRSAIGPDGTETEWVMEAKRGASGVPKVRVKAGSVSGVTDMVNPTYHVEVYSASGTLARLTFDEAGNLKVKARSVAEEVSQGDHTENVVVGNWSVEAAIQATLKAARVNLADATEPAVMGLQLQSYLSSLLTALQALATALSAATVETAAATAGVALNTALAPLLSPAGTAPILAKKTFLS